MYTLYQTSLWSPETIIFPLRGPWAEFILGIEFIIMYLGMHIFLVILGQYFKTKRKEQESRNLGWGVIILSIAFTFFWYFQGDFLVTTTPERNLMNLYGYLTMSAGIIAIFILSGKLGQFDHKSFKKIGFGLFAGIILTIILQSREIGRILILFIAFPVLIIYMLFYSRLLFQVAQNSKNVKGQIFRFLISLCFLLVGFLIIGDFFIFQFGLGIRLIGDFLIIKSLISLKFTLIKLPILTEFDWTEKLRGVLIIHENGVPIFSRFYKYGEEGSTDETLISGAISTIRTILDTSPTHERLSSVQIGDKSMIFDERPHCLFVVIADESLISLQSRLHDFADEFMRMFSKALKDWRGDTEKFETVEWLADKYF